MCQVNIFKAKTELSRLITLLENAKEDEIIIARNGKPVARLLPWSGTEVKKRIGVAKGLFEVSDDFSEDDEAIAGSFAESSL
jgi:antitoxin (DNA-binding transcriptional repressor) of toxin-antitoxin stability system